MSNKNEDIKMPVQPIVDGRFVANRIIEKLLETSLHDMNSISHDAQLGEYTQQEHAQFAQLIGYSVGGFSMLSYVDDETYYRATAEQLALTPLALTPEETKLIMEHRDEVAKKKEEEAAREEEKREAEAQAKHKEFILSIAQLMTNNVSEGGRLSSDFDAFTADPRVNEGIGAYKKDLIKRGDPCPFKDDYLFSVFVHEDALNTKIFFEALGKDRWT